MSPRLTHVAITMPPGGEEAARRFYRDLLGLPEVPKPEAIRHRGGCWFDAGGLDVHLQAEPAHAGSDHRRHFGLEVDDVAAVRARLETAGVATEQGPPAPWPRFFARDPFGNRIEVHGAGAFRG